MIAGTLPVLRECGLQRHRHEAGVHDCDSRHVETKCDSGEDPMTIAISTKARTALSTEMLFDRCFGPLVMTTLECPDKAVGGAGIVPLPEVKSSKRSPIFVSERVELP